MAKIITKKSEIPKSAQRNIKNFNKLTNNQAIYQYELNKLIRRAGGEYGQFLKGYYQMPERVYKKDIEEIRSLRNVKLRDAREKYETERRIDRITLARIEYEQPRIEAPVIKNTLDINDLIEKEKQYDNVQDYLKETGQAINPFTGEVLEEGDVANIIESAKQLLDDLREFVLQEMDRSVVSNSSYRNGRTRSSASRDWIEKNINNAGDMILKEIDRIKTSDSSIKEFADKFSDSTKLQSLYDAISEYLASAYYVVGNAIGSNFQASQVYSLLHDGPMTLADSKRFEDEE